MATPSSVSYTGFHPPPPPPPGYAYPYQFAGLAERFGAAILDLLVLLVATIVIAIPLGVAAAILALGTGTPVWVWGAFFGPFVLLLFGLWLVYFTYFEGTTGQTPGKRALGLRVVVASTGRPPDLGRAFLRSLFRIVDWLPFLYLVGFVVALLTQRRQRIGDLVADTLVVKA
ncbi:MAG TPA: RDD family protein [Thermoplasmata archaeon]|nr:RDD family protein [Thermoplasmata archaeon]